MMRKVLKQDIQKMNPADRTQAIGKISAGKEVEVTFNLEGQMVVEGINEMTLGKWLPGVSDLLSIRCRAVRYLKYFGGREPSEKTLEKWVNEGWARTITGHKTEPDGYGPDGSPSWLIALGMI